MIIEKHNVEMGVLYYSGKQSKVIVLEAIGKVTSHFHLAKLDFGRVFIIYNSSYKCYGKKSTVCSTCLLLTTSHFYFNRK